MEDWKEACDILRCNLNFHQCKRYDCVIINDERPGTTVARLRSLLRCRLISGKEVDIALVHTFTRNSWKPHTMWDNCQIRAEARESSFILMDFVVRGALLCPIPSFNSDSRLHYIIDTVDGDMLLRVNSWLWSILWVTTLWVICKMVGRFQIFMYVPVFVANDRFLVTWRCKSHNQMTQALPFFKLFVTLSFQYNFYAKPKRHAPPPHISGKRTS